MKKVLKHYDVFLWIVCKVLKYSYASLWLFVIPTVIGFGTGSILLRFYTNCNEHFLAAVAVCFFSGAVGTWMPMLFVMTDADFGEKRELFVAVTLLLWIAGCVAPILNGFQDLGPIITVLLLFSNLFTNSVVYPISRKDSYREKDNL